MNQDPPHDSEADAMEDPLPPKSYVPNGHSGMSSSDAPGPAALRTGDRWTAAIGDAPSPPTVAVADIATLLNEFRVLLRHFVRLHDNSPKPVSEARTAGPEASLLPPGVDAELLIH